MADRDGAAQAYTRRPLQSGAGDATGANTGSMGRISRKLETPPPVQSSTLDSGRINRKASDGYGSPFTQRSVYHYHSDYYPSHRIFNWITWPNCCRPICYTWGPRYTFGFFWPYYHRRFIFISIGGYWPSYAYRRYYWYGCHPYAWYGDYPPEYVIAGDTYNYYYYSDKPPQSQAVAEAQEKLEEKPPAEPAQETQADRYFDQAVKAFGAGDYAAATAKFHDAQQLSPNDIVLPFAHAQALFAGGEYTKAAEVLRGALAKSSPDKEGVFYPRGLYSDQTVLQQQVEQLAQKVETDPYDADLQLLLGYQLLGAGKHDEAASHLQSARLNPNNTQAATTLINLLEKLQKPESGSESSGEQQKNTSEDLQPQSTEMK